ncbi:MAG TPA: hypothetical protein VGN00_30040 [Puia sp.]
MRRLIALIKRIIPLTPEAENALSSILKKKILQQRERLGEGIPPGSWIFIEEGFLLLLQREKTRWACKNFYYEGVSTVLYNVGSAELTEQSFNVQAVEESIIYYLTPEDEDTMGDAFAHFFYARRLLNARSYRQHNRRARLFTLDHELDRIIYVTKIFTILFRAPEEHLADFLCVKKRMGRTILSNIYKKERAIKIMNKTDPD